MRLVALVVSALLIFGFCEAEPVDEDDVISVITNDVLTLSNLDNTTSSEVTDVPVPEVTASTIGNNKAGPVVATASNRTGHARMRPLEELFPRKPPITTTSSSVGPITEYDYWLYFTTPRRPRFSFRDFPGKPGVASWKEISPVAAKEDRKDPKSEPTAAEVYNTASDWSKNELTLSVCIFSAILLRFNNLVRL